jgi:hypothetical protein
MLYILYHNCQQNASHMRIKMQKQRKFMQLCNFPAPLQKLFIYICGNLAKDYADKSAYICIIAEIMQKNTRRIGNARHCDEAAPGISCKRLKNQ